MDNNYKQGPKIPTQNLEQMNYTEQAKAKKHLDVLPIPDNVIANATAAQKVGKGNLCRILGTAGGWVTFGDSTVGAPNGTTVNAVQTIADWFLIIATDDYIRTSAIMRVEVTNEQ